MSEMHYDESVHCEWCLRRVARLDMLSICRGNSSTGVFLTCSEECRDAMQLQINVIDMYKNFGRWASIDEDSAKGTT